MQNCSYCCIINMNRILVCDWVFQGQQRSFWDNALLALVSTNIEASGKPWPTEDCTFWLWFAMMSK